MKKRLLTTIMALSLTVSLLGCQQETTPTQPTETETETEAAPVSTEETEATEPTEVTEPTETQEPETETSTETPEADADVTNYIVCTDKSVEEVETFAKQITTCFANSDWTTLADMVYYPITINEKYYANKEKFLAEDWSNVYSSSFTNNIANAETTNLFANWQGIMISDGEVWFGEIEGNLKVFSINYYDGKNVPDESTGIVGHWILDEEKTDDALQNYENLMEIFGTGIHVGGTLAINEDNTLEYSLALAEYFTGTYTQDENMIIVDYVNSMDESGQCEFSFENIDGTWYIISQYEGELIYWSKLAE